MRKVLSAMLAVLFLVMLAMPAFAAEAENKVVAPRYTYIHILSSDLSINESTGIASCKASCYAASGHTVEIVCRLQKYTGSTWSMLKTWSTSGFEYASINENWAVYSGYDYRLYIMYNVRNAEGNLVETTTRYDYC